MKLLCFAHYKEAETFIKEEAFKSWPCLLDGVFANGQDYLLLTGEGVFTAQSRLALFLGIQHESIEAVYNFGVAGRLDSRLSVNEVYPVEQVYLQTPLGFEFQSFALAATDQGAQSPRPSVDVVTAFERVQSLEQKNQLLTAGSLVDKELWGLAFVCKQLNKKLYSYKVISDDASSEPFCDQVQNESEFFSDLLYIHWQKNKQSLHHATKSVESGTGATVTDNRAYNQGRLWQRYSENIHLTHSQQNHYENLLLKIKAQSLSEDQLLHKIESEKIIQQKNVSPKQKSKLLLQAFDLEIHPLKKQLLNKTEAIFSGCKESHIQWDSPSDFENSELKFTLLVKNQKDLQMALERLYKFEYAEYLNFLKGNGIEL
ncbi:MAG: hypothetical protein ACOYOK_06505 [Pseudobdellovibrionaceae bacterium]